MNRKEFMKYLTASLGVVTFPGLIGCKNMVTERKPNMIFILADDLGYGDLGCYGQEKIETPNIDAIAKRGIKFSQFYSGAPVCAPARCVLMTGLHSGHAYIRGNDEWGERGDVWDYAKMVEDPNLEGQRPIPPGTQTIGRLLQNNGYKTAIVGKWGLGGPLTEGIPNKHGFDFFYGYNCQRQAHTFFPKHLWKNTEKVPLENELVVPRTPLEEGADPLDPKSYTKFWLNQYSPDLMFNEITHFVEENKNNPFFLYWATPIPHVPLQAPQRWVDYYVKKLGDEKPYLGDRGYFPHRYPHAAYAAMISYLDEQVGHLVNQLKNLNLYNNTVIFFSSDNGPTYAGGSDSGYFDSAKPFSSEAGRGKGTVFEGGIRIPLVAAWPGKIQPGSKTDHISAFCDVLPTLCEITGSPIPLDIDGISFLPSLLEKDQQSKHQFLYWEFPASGGQQAVRMGKWKAIRRNLMKGNLDIELYDLENDIREEHNVAAKYPEIVEKIAQIMKNQHVEAEINRFRMAALGDND
jgi:arylsulfatase A-like enzyme